MTLAGELTSFRELGEMSPHKRASRHLPSSGGNRLFFSVSDKSPLVDRLAGAIQNSAWIIAKRPLGEKWANFRRFSHNFYLSSKAANPRRTQQ
jgi:hypothetical protein